MPEVDESGRALSAAQKAEMEKAQKEQQAAMAKNKALNEAFNAGKTAAAAVKRLGVFYVPNGMSMGYWLPKAEGPLAELPPTLQSLARVRDRVLLLGGAPFGIAGFETGALRVRSIPQVAAALRHFRKGTALLMA